MATAELTTRLDRARPIVHSSAATGVHRLIEDRGGSVERVFHRAHVSPRILETPVERVDLRNYCLLFEEAACQTGDTNFGLWFGSQFQPAQLGVLGYLALTAPTLDIALAKMIGYFPAYQQNSVLRRFHADGHLKLEYRITDGGIVQRRQDAELSLGIFCNIFRAALGPDWGPVRVDFEHPNPGDVADHERVFDAPVHFDQQTNAIVFRASDLSAPMPTADHNLAAVLDGLLLQLGTERSTPGDVVSTVRREVQVRISRGCPTLEDIADALHWSPATLKRRLRLGGTTYQQLVDDLRRKLAMDYLREGMHSMTEISERLGYSEASAFSRAFTRWTGLSPRDHLKRQARGRQSIIE